MEMARRVVEGEGGRTTDDASSTTFLDVRTRGGSTARRVVVVAVVAVLAVLGISAGRDNRFPINFVKTANILGG